MNDMHLLVLSVVSTVLLAGCQPAAPGVSEVTPINSVTSGPTQVAQDIPAVQLHNESNIPVCTMYGVENGQENWGVNWLPGDRLIPPGAIYDLWLPPGTWKFRLEDCQGRLAIEFTDIEIPTTWEEPTPWYLSNTGETGIDWAIETGN